MDPRDEVGIRIYNPSPQVVPASHDPSLPGADMPPAAAPGPGGRKRQKLGSGIQKTLNKTSMLANFLPTGTLLAFEMVLPAIYGRGECSPVTNTMTLSLLGLCALSCFFFHFIDGFPGPGDQMNYGFVTCSGLVVFKNDLQVPDHPRFRVCINDFVHAFMSALVFLAIAFSDNRVTHCLFRNHAKEIDEVMESFPLMVGIVCSTLFLIFPTNRSGLGLMAS